MNNKKLKKLKNTFLLCFILSLVICQIEHHKVFCDDQIQESAENRNNAMQTPTVKHRYLDSGDTLRILNPQAPGILNPHLTLSVKDLEAARITYEPLASADRNGILVPFLADGIPSRENGGVAADGKSVTWKIKKGVKWSDGEPFTAEDVLFTYQFISNPEVNSGSSSRYQVIKDIRIIDQYTVKINFKDVNPAWKIPFIGAEGGLIIPRHIFEPYNGSNARNAPANTLPVGTGPYRVMPPGIKPQEVLLLGAQLIETNKIVFEPNPYFREKGKPFFRRVELRGGGTPDEAARLVLKEGETDFSQLWGISLSHEALTKLETGGKGRLLINFGSKIDRILVNFTAPRRETEDGERSSLKFPHPFFKDKKVRQAFAHAINQKAIAELYGPTGRLTTNILVAPQKYNSPNLFYEFNLKKAAALLDEAGWIDTDGDGVRDKDGVKMKIVYQSYFGATNQQTQRLVKKILESIGIEVEVKIVLSPIMFGPGAAHPDSFYRFNADIQELIMYNTVPEPLSYMRFFSCRSIPQKANNWSGLNIPRYCNPVYDALIKQAATELNPDKRRQLIIKMNDLLIEDVVMIPLVNVADVQGVNRNIEGVDITPWDSTTWNIKDWRRIP